VSSLGSWLMVTGKGSIDRGGGENVAVESNDGASARPLNTPGLECGEN
jgi:hypothetical protein